MRLRWLVAACLLLLSSPAYAQPAPDGADTWDITAAHGPTKTVTFTTTEGTWMNLDVHPSGQTIVFDLLGDIYTLPIDGGTATRIAGGPALQIQPRYSPDGSRISYTSDRDGADNIWTMAADGSDRQQVTDADFRLLNNAVWTPDGQYLIARKHFTSTRSLGAGEMWMYHRSGGDGVRLTERRTNQKDAGEPAVSPDGRYLYYSEDMTSGETFAYNKDPNGQIYVIRRLNMETGALDNLITGAGGAVRPQPSPDGRYIAFVRRVRDESVLFLYDRQTGAEAALYDGLTKDQQETWAIFGVYPNFDWTPDSQHIVFYARGGFHKINVETRAVTDIPFEAKVEQRVTEAVAFSHDIGNEQFTAKMIRDAVTSPDGQTLVFHAVGRLWRKALPSGTPQPLTSPDRFAYDPAFSPDGQQIVYTTWDDAARGGIHLMNADGSNARELSQRPGYYYNPQFSPDGSKVVYRRATGNNMLGFVYGVAPGLYWMDVATGTRHFIREAGRTPQFSADGSRIYFLSGGGIGKTYQSVRLDGGGLRTLFDLKYVDAVLPSPDGRWVAFRDLYNVYIAPFPSTAGPITLSKDMTALPVQQVTRDAGTALHWSADSERLHWVLGPEYFARDLQDTFAFVAGGAARSQELPAIDTTGTPIGLTLPTDRPTGRMAFTNARLITMDPARTGDGVIENGTIVINRNRIAAVGPAADVSIPDGTTVIDAAGRTIMPGLVDVHAHANHFFSGLLPEANWSYYANLAYGVTTMHDPSATTETVFSMSELVKAGRMVGPRSFSTGTILYGADGDFKAVINDLADARSHLRRLKAVGAFSVKSYNQPRRNQRQQVLEAARAYEMLVMPEGGSTFFHNLTMIQDGHTGIEHALPIAPLYRDVLRLWEATDVRYTPTLMVGYGGLWGENYFYQMRDVWRNEKLLTFTPRPIIDARARRRVKAPASAFYHKQLAASANDLWDRGVGVQLGAHGQLQGLGAHWELWMFAQGGMTPMEALRAATLSGARYLGLHNDIGSLTEGKLADLLVLSKNPLADIRNSTSIEQVMVGGRLYDADTMDEVGNHPNERPKLYWERDETSNAFIWRDGGFAVPHACEVH
ncbi:amidohydrolase family protein [Salisaeta longa]|uniref:amidohydrolase family protein n=1 Tax=Salisaeta longa TaxID=503170 RepID=UPI00040E4DE5|nr:amidohydrolase family protein [Salisaeta longa]